MVRSLSWGQSRALGAFVRHYPAVHLSVGLVGNMLFIVGTVLFIANAEDVGVWFFLVGSCGMFLGSLGEALRIMGKHRLQRTDTDPISPDRKWSETGRPSSTLE